MGRQVKLQDKPGEYGDTSTAFKAPNGKYYSSENVWLFLQRQDKMRQKCLERLADYMGYQEGQFLPTLANKKVKEFKDAYGYDVLLETIETHEKDIHWAMEHKDFHSELNALQYIFAIIQNHIMETYRKKVRDERIQALMDRDFEIKDRETSAQATRSTDVSHLIGDDDVWT